MCVVKCVLQTEECCSVCHQLIKTLDCDQFGSPDINMQILRSHRCFLSKSLDQHKKQAGEPVLFFPAQTVSMFPFCFTFVVNVTMLLVVQID